MNLENLPDDILDKINEMVKENYEMEEFYKINKGKMHSDFIFTTLALIKNKEELQNQNKWNTHEVEFFLNDLLINKYGYTHAQIKYFYYNKWRKLKDLKDFSLYQY